MNHNSFPSREQTPSSQNDGDTAEYPSFGEHMAGAAESNARVLMRPSLKNEVLEGGNFYASPTVEHLSEKIKGGEKLNVDDITALTDEKGFSEYRKEVSDYLSDAGIKDGTDFDISLPGEVTNPDGSQSEIPLSVSFRNGEDFTRVDFYTNPHKRDGGITIESYKGPGDDGVDVGYKGPVSKDIRRRDFQSTDFNKLDR